MSRGAGCESSKFYPVGAPDATLRARPAVPNAALAAAVQKVRHRATAVAGRAPGRYEVGSTFNGNSEFMLAFRGGPIRIPAARRHRDSQDGIDTHEWNSS